MTAESATLRAAAGSSPAPDTRASAAGSPATPPVAIFAEHAVVRADASRSAGAVVAADPRSGPAVGRLDAGEVRPAALFRAGREGLGALPPRRLPQRRVGLSRQGADH